MPKIGADFQATKIAFFLYLCYMASFFLRIPSRLPVLGALRLDLLLVAAIFGLILMAKLNEKQEQKIAKYLLMLFIYALLVLPFTTWPGTVITSGVPDLIRATIFFYFTYKLVLDERRLKLVVYLFLIVNTVRVIEPLFLNITQDYWGSKTTFGWDQVNRLSGSPHDTINANGLAFVIASILPFYHYLFGTQGIFKKLIYWGSLPILMYTMSLTLSRSGLLAVAIIYGVVFLKSKKKGLLMLLGIAGLAIFLGSLNEIQRDRYLSIFSSDTKSSGSAEGRVSGLSRDLDVAMLKPIVGHGLGASREANWNFGGRDQPSHNLWLEVFQELGAIGLIIFILYTREIYKNFKITNRLAKEKFITSEFLTGCIPAMQVWLIMNFLFSFASYGLTSYEWYLFGGFSIALTRILNDKQLLSGGEKGRV